MKLNIIARELEMVRCIASDEPKLCTSRLNEGEFEEVRDGVKKV